MDTNDLRRVLTQQHPHLRTGPFQLPRQDPPRDTMTPSTDDISMGDSGGYDSLGESKHSTPPRNSSLVDLLHRWRPPESQPRDGSETEWRQGQHDDRVNDGVRSHVNHHQQQVADEEEYEDVKSMEDSDDPPSGPTPQPKSVSRPRSASTGALPSDGAKRSRYLREGDRRTIISRLDNGEKQAELAREFGVTRAAICHINKNRAEILGRSTRADVHAAARHPKRRMSKAALLGRRQQRQLSQSQHQRRHMQTDNHTQPQNQPPSPQGHANHWHTTHHHYTSPSFFDSVSTVHVVHSLALAKHLTTLRSRDLPGHNFRAIADRAIWLLLEEALAYAPTCHVDSHSDADAERSPSAIVMGETGFPMLAAFRRIQPDSLSGFVTFTHEESSTYGESTPRLRRMCAPADLAQHRVLALDATCGDARMAVLAIQSLLDIGVRADAVVFVTLVISASAVDELYQHFPLLRIVAAAVDPEVSRDGEVRPGVGSFQHRYFRATTIYQRPLGSTVEL